MADASESVTDAMATTRAFWNASPCNGQSDLATRQRYRYRSEPWLPGMMERIGRAHTHVVEIGSGMGTDALTCCRFLPAGGSYRGLDYSTESVAAARQALAEADSLGWPLSVHPTFEVGNAERLPFEADSVECVFSFGVLHHTAHPQRAFDEVLRVLKPGGKGYVILYRKWSLKVTIAKALRALQHGVDLLTHRERSLFDLVKGRHFERLMGTAVLECFGVPYMDWFDEREMRRYFSDFIINALYPIGYSLPWFHTDPAALGPHGYYWVIEVEKAA
jgi:SAM-dependent methyltransferase